MKSQRNVLSIKMLGCVLFSKMTSRSTKKDVGSNHNHKCFTKNWGHSSTQCRKNNNSVGKFREINLQNNYI